MIKQAIKNRICGGWRAVLGAALLPLAFVSCIDEDLSDCGKDNALEYRLELSASLRLSLDEQLTTPAEQQLASALKTELADIMTDKAKVMDLSFFKYEDGAVAKHERMEPDANSLAITVYMDRGNYHNIALAATHSIDEVSISGASSYSGISLRQAVTDTLDAHSAAIYMGYCEMNVDNVSGSYFVPLYMINAVPVLVVNPAGSPAKAIAAYTRGVSAGLMCADSTFVDNNRTVMRTHMTEGGGLLAFHTVCFPSADAPVVRDSYDPNESAGSIWEMDLYTRLPDGKYVKNTLYMKNPLKAGEMQVVKVKLTDGGEVVSDNPEVGVSVELDWKPGGDFDVEM